MPALEWTLAARYLKLARRRPLALHAISAFIALAAVAVQGGAFWMLRRHAGFLIASATWRGFFQIAKPASVVAFVLVAFFIALARRLTIFTTISTYGLFIGSGALVVVLSVMSGFEKDLKHKILGTHAHIVVTAPDRLFTDYAPIGERLKAIPGVISVTPFISNEVMISSQSNLSGVVLKGIDPASIGSVTDLGRNIEQGGLDNLLHPEKLLSEAAGWRRRPPPAGGLEGEPADDLLGKHRRPTGVADDGPIDRSGDRLGGDALPAEQRVLPAVIIGRELAKNLRIYLSDEVNLVSPMGDIGPTGPMPRSRPFRVGGVFYSGMYEYDSKYIYVSIAAAQKFLGTDDEITGFELKVSDADVTGPAVGRIKAALGAGYDVEDWQELNRNLFSALRIEKIAMFIVLCFIILVAGFSIVANGIMLVQEKRGEIAILKSMGASDRAVLNTFLIIGLFMGAIGSVVGIASGVGACMALRYFGLDLDTDVYYIARLPVEMNPAEITAVLVAAMLIALVATLYPAFLAARLRPVEGLRQDRG